MGFIPCKLKVLNNQHPFPTKSQLRGVHPALKHFQLSILSLGLSINSNHLLGAGIWDAFPYPSILQNPRIRGNAIFKGTPQENPRFFQLGFHRLLPFLFPLRMTSLFVLECAPEEWDEQGWEFFHRSDPLNGK